MDAPNTPHASGSKRTKPADGRPRLLSLTDLYTHKLNCSERTAHKIIAEPWFPAPLQLGPRLFRWLEDEVDAAIAAGPRRSAPNAEPPQLLRGRIERMKRTGEAA